MPRARLLILEDDPGVGKIMHRIATASGLEAHVVDHAQAFFSAVEDWQPTHISLDLVMPEVDGVQVLIELSKRHCRAKIIITSGMGVRVLDAAQRSADEHGLNVVGILPKPFSAVSLRALLGESAVTPAATTVRPRDGTANPVEVTEAELQRGIANGELRLDYQPKINCSDGSLAGFEALVRWAHPQQGIVMPDRFVTFAERHGLIDALTNVVLEQALHWFAASFPQTASIGDGATLPRSPSTPTLRSPSVPTLSINLSAVSLEDLTFVDRISDRCRLAGVPAERIIFEVTETSAMVNPVTALAMLTRLRMKGFQLSIDDFGTGYSSMLQFVRIPFSEIKIDKSFVMSATRSAESRAVVQSIVDMGKALGVKSVAEGVEDAKAMELLEQIGCDFAQGYWIGRPMGPDAVRAWAQNRPGPMPG